MTRISELEKSLKEARERIQCSRQQLKNLKAHGKQKVVKLLGDPDSPNYKTGFRSSFHILWKGYKEVFELRSVSETKEHQYSEALYWIATWSPPVKLSPPSCFLCEAEPGTIDTSEGPMGEFCYKLFGEPR